MLNSATFFRQLRTPFPALLRGAPSCGFPFDRGSLAIAEALGAEGECLAEVRVLLLILQYGKSHLS